MRQQEVFKKIGVILKELNEQYKYLETNPEDMNSLELELFVANAHFLADHAEILNKLNLQLSTTKLALPAAAEEQKAEEKYFEPVVRQPLKLQNTAADKQNDATVINFEIAPATDDEQIAEDETEIIRHELDIEEIPDWDEEGGLQLVNDNRTEVVIEDEITVLPKDATVEDPVPAPPVNKPTMVDLVAEPVQQPLTERPKQVESPVKAAEQTKEEPLTINQRMSAQLNKGGVTDQPAGQPISDLKHAISLNDKLLYIKDLFNGYNLAYSEAIEILNRLSSFEDAERFLTKNYVTKNNWESKADTAAKFFAVLKRRYI